MNIDTYLDYLYASTWIKSHEVSNKFHNLSGICAAAWLIETYLDIDSGLQISRGRSIFDQKRHAFHKASSEYSDLEYSRMLKKNV